MKKLLLISALMLATAAGVAAAADLPVNKSGNILVDKTGMTLYTFDKDVANSGKSTCNGPCATLWPPLMAEQGAKAAGEYTIVTRDDGAKQWAHEGKPLYRYKSDQKPGERNGDNFKNVWHAAQD